MDKISVGCARCPVKVSELVSKETFKKRDLPAR